MADRTKAMVSSARLVGWMLVVWTMVNGLTACTDDKLTYCHFEPIGQQVWYQDVPVRFTTQWGDSAACYDLLLTVRHTDKFPYGNLPVTVDLIDSIGKVRRINVQFAITDGHGNWNGTGFGTLYQCQIPVATQVTPLEAKRIVVWPAVDGCDSLPGVTDVGIAIRRR